LLVTYYFKEKGLLMTNMTFIIFITLIFFTRYMYKK